MLLLGFRTGGGVVGKLRQKIKAFTTGLIPRHISNELFFSIFAAFSDNLWVTLWLDCAIDLYYAL